MIIRPELNSKGYTGRHVILFDTAGGKEAHAVVSAKVVSLLRRAYNDGVAEARTSMRAALGLPVLRR